MKKFQFIMILAISLFLLYNPGFAQSQTSSEQEEMKYEDTLDTIQERLKQEGEFDHWPCQNGPIRAGIILSSEHFFSALKGAEAVHEPDISLVDWIKDILAVEYRYRWVVQEKDKVDVNLTVAQTCLQAQNLLIRGFAVSSLPSDLIHLSPRGEEYDIHAGDVSFVTGMNSINEVGWYKIKFVRNNIYVEITAYDEMKKEIKAIAEDIDRILLSMPTGEEAEKLKPVIKKFQPAKGTVAMNEKPSLMFEIQSPAGNQLVLTPPGGIELVSGWAFTDDQAVFKWNATGGRIRRDMRPGTYFYTPETEGLHTVELLVADKNWGLISQASTEINVVNGAGEAPDKGAGEAPDNEQQIGIDHDPGIQDIRPSNSTNPPWSYYGPLNNNNCLYALNYLSICTSPISPISSPVNTNWNYKEPWLGFYPDYLTNQYSASLNYQATNTASNLYRFTIFDNYGIYNSRPSWVFPGWSDSDSNSSINFPAFPALSFW